MAPKISIIVPIFNAEKYLEDCINSILNQTYKDWELILVNDGSIDKSEIICEKFLKNNPKIKYFYKSNGGVSNTRNFGIDHASGEYIMFVDSDDILNPGIVDILVKNVSEEGEISACLVKRFSNANSIFTQTDSTTLYLSNIEQIYKEFKSKDILHPPFAKIFKRSIVNRYQLRFDENLSLGEDLCFNLAYLHYISSGTIVLSPLYYYRDTPQSLTKKISVNYGEIQLYLLDKNLDFISNKGIEYDFSTETPGIISDIFLSICKASAPIKDKIKEIKLLRQHRIFELLSKDINIKSKLIISSIKIISLLG